MIFVFIGCKEAKKTEIQKILKNFFKIMLDYWIFLVYNNVLLMMMGYCAPIVIYYFLQYFGYMHNICCLSLSKGTKYA